MPQEPLDDPSGFAPPSEPLPDPGRAPGPQPPPYGRPYGTPGPPPGPPPGQAPGLYGAPPYQPYPGQPYGYGPPPADPTLAEWWQRLVARIVDGVIIWLVVSPLWIWFLVWYFQQPVPETSTGEPDIGAVLQQELVFTGLSLLIGLAQALVTFGYDWFQHGKWGQTVGKRVVKTKVVSLPGRAPLTGAVAAKRAGAYAVAGQIPVISLVNALWHLWDKPNRQCLHDKFAGTVVVKTMPAGAPR